VVKLSLLLYEQSATQCRCVAEWLESAGYGCVDVNNQSGAISLLAGQRFDAVLLACTHRESVVETVSYIRRRLQSDIPILYIPDGHDSVSVTCALKAGASDYLAKPLNSSSLTAHLGRLLKSTSRTDNLLDCHPYQFNGNTHNIHLDGVDLGLTRTEYELAAYLFSCRGRVILTEEILDEVGHSQDSLRSITHRISLLKHKLRLTRASDWQLMPVHSIGYRLIDLRSLESQSREIVSN
jgi:DNA-binding response OmpR family regulator